MTYHTNDEVTYFRCCRTLDGRLEPIDTARRNGRSIPLFAANILEPRLSEGCQSDEPSLEFLDEICYALTERQRQVWLTRLDSPSAAEAARRLGITHPAVLDFIDRMAARNVYVRHWRDRNKHER